MRSLRLYFQNINTLKIGQGRKETEESFKRLSASGVSITLLSEINKNMEMEEVMETIQLELEFFFERIDIVHYKAYFPVTVFLQQEGT